MVRPGPSAPLWGAAGKVGYTLSCVAAALVLMVSGFSYFVVKDVSSIGGSNAIVSGPSIGAQNILVMGLESRTDYDGNILPPDLLAAMHACSVQGVENGCGGQDTNTLILIHIFADGRKAVGFSIPRDDWVTYPQAYDNQTQGKIDQEYGFAWAQSLSQTANSKMSRNQRYLLANEAGQAATVATVSQFTGVHIDHFAEMNLAGFYELAKVLGGVEVCLNHPVAYDPYSGFYAHHAGYQKLNASMALAFVRQRHGLTNGDLDRTKRQQAVIDSVIHQLRTEGVLSDLTKLNDLLSVARQYVITDSGWNLLQFIGGMQGLSIGHIKFYTLQPLGYITIDNQDANQVSVPQTQQIVHQAFYPTPSTPAAQQTRTVGPKPTTNADAAATTVDVYNGGSTKGLAAAVSGALVRQGYRAGIVQNATTPATATQVYYGTGSAASAARIASQFGVTAAPSATVSAGHVEIILGANATVPGSTTPGSTTPGSTTSGSTTSGSTTSGSTASSAPVPTAGSQGGAVTVNPKTGIPCVN
jgi:LCP family protein required for cell wall assembly